MSNKLWDMVVKLRMDLVDREVEPGTATWVIDSHTYRDILNYGQSHMGCWSSLMGRQPGLMEIPVRTIFSPRTEPLLDWKEGSATTDLLEYRLQLGIEYRDRLTGRVTYLDSPLTDKFFKDTVFTIS